MGVSSCLREFRTHREHFESISASRYRSWLFKAWLSSRSFDLEHHFFMASLDTGSGINNGFLLALGTAGLTSLIAYILFISSLSRDKGFLILAAWLGFSWGFILHPYMFVFYSIVNGLTSFRTKNPTGFGKLLPAYGRGQYV